MSQQQQGTPDVDQLSSARKSTMLARHITYEKECLLCKVVSGTAFGAFGAFNIWRAKSMWGYMGIRDKMFNVAAVSVIFMISALNFSYAYRIHLG
mmetsp:Transcript_6888/g.8218  ORF Transcript_6888/g.8218 Transcript_6888/m.8218 type:complete len:95 (-) Transcript_6888:266-550(-)|eukprot:CAMPEP_0170469526 /NCGR_PEP_ID=MMETSP0123-20130129/12323_1 /TAXON_ID=182087 /ORGANISM="Favella ehrenbergii, Strain Fehren 1" /LENGTH=94 /DNA_ID=CAMNT_0010736417 /DNA_START=20 /DNA_END=304 /DNA_ORIENTATION=-